MAKSEFEGERETYRRRARGSLWEPGESSSRESWSSAMQPDARWNHDNEEIFQAQRLARALGWLSIGLGITEVAAPGTVARLAGLDDGRGVVRALGLRELAHGVGILSRRKPVGWLWSRVVGDVIDLAVLGTAAASPYSNKRRLAAAAAAVTGMTMLDFRASQQLTEISDEIEEDDSIHVVKALLINRPAEEIYRFWRDLANLPRVMQHLESVEIIDDKRSRWVAKGPGGRRIEWEAEITEDRPNQVIAWRSVENPTVQNVGSVWFEPAPGGRGTVLRVELSYRPPAGVFGATIAKLFGEEPELQVTEDLRRLKQLMETGEIISTEGQSAGRAQSTSWKYDRVGRRLATAF